MALHRLALLPLLCAAPAACAAPSPGPPALPAAAPPAASPSALAPPAVPASASAPTPAVSASAPTPAPAANIRRWAYRGQLLEGATPVPLALNLVELRRFSVDAHPVISLGVEIDGVLVGREQLADKGFSFAPFAVFSPYITVAGGKRDGQVSWWLIEGDAPPAEAALRGALRGGPSIVLSRGLPQRSAIRNEPADRDFLYRRRVGSWDSFCTGHEHPSPETGDFFSSERCYAPSVGLTSLSFRSVWGAFQLELIAPPAADPAPLPG